MSRPWLIVVSGPPCSGKSTLAARLADATGWAVVAKDGFKEILFDALGTGDAAWSRRLSHAAFRIQFAAAESLLAAGVNLLLDGNFSPPLHSDPILALADRRARVLQIACRAAREELAIRRQRRARSAMRHPGHLDQESALMPADLGRYHPLPAVPTLMYDSTGGPEAYAGLLGDLHRAGVPVARPTGP